MGIFVAVYAVVAVWLTATWKYDRTVHLEGHGWTFDGWWGVLHEVVGWSGLVASLLAVLFAFSWLTDAGQALAEKRQREEFKEEES
jgi:hypothetical protein